MVRESVQEPGQGQGLGPGLELGLELRLGLALGLGLALALAPKTERGLPDSMLRQALPAPLRMSHRTMPRCPHRKEYCQRNCIQSLT